ncbi:MAG TPA: serine--tRNA ligase [Spirillospora sp.]|nr:serine--tRNA ligase [Spirillospora sp.]
MLDINLIREKPEWIKEQIAKLNDPGALERIDVILKLDQQRRSLLTQSEAIQAQRNRLNKGMGRLRGDKTLDDSERARRAYFVTAALEAGDYQKAAAIMDGQGELDALPAGVDTAAALDKLTEVLRGLGDKVNSFNDQIAQVEAQLNEHMLWLPNLPHSSVPVFDSEEYNTPWKPEGEFFEFDFQPKPHWELGPALDIIDFERGVKLAGTRSYILKGMGARLQRALINFFLDMARAKGFIELYVPYMVQEEMMIGSAQFPKFRDNVYYDPDANLYMLPTAEVAITNIHRDEILDEAQLPLNYVAHTPCFRREKMSAGRDVRGIKRVHQFEKVEMYKFTTPETSYDELENLTEAASDICRALKIPFRRLEIVTGDLGFSASKKYDIEMWSPGCEEWLEVSSCSNTEDFQARRANVRFRRDGEKRPLFVHTLNGSGLATPRVLIAIMENYQQADGSIRIPEVLVPYMGGLEVIEKV